LQTLLPLTTFFFNFKVLAQQGLGKYSQDAEFVRYTAKELQEALEMTREEMDQAAHRLLLEEKIGANLSFRFDHKDADDLE